MLTITPTAVLDSVPAEGPEVFAVIGGKLFLLQRVRHDHYHSTARSQQIRTIEIKP